MIHDIDEQSRVIFKKSESSVAADNRIIASNYPSFKQQSLKRFVEIDCLRISKASTLKAQRVSEKLSGRSYQEERNNLLREKVLSALMQRFVATARAVAYYAKRARGLAWIQFLFTHKLMVLLQNSTPKLLAKREREQSLQKKIFSKVRLINRFVVPILRYRNYAKSSSSLRNLRW